MKGWLRVDFNDDDEDIQRLITAGEQYIKNAVGTVDTTNELYKQALVLLVSEWYDNRTATTVGQVSHSLRFSLESILNQLKYCKVESSS